MKNKLVKILFGILVITLAGCNLPAGNQTPPVAANTAAYMTVQAALTSMAPTAVTPTQTPQPSPTVPVITTITATGTPCNMFTFIQDVTVNDGDDFAPGAAFTKIWRVKNVGTCTWTTAYSLAFYQENSMGGPATVPLTANVAPGQTIDLSVNLVAPATAGSYTGKWALKDQFGNFFFTTLGKPVWVIIEVVAPMGE